MNSPAAVGGSSNVCVQSVAGKAKPKKRQTRSVPLGKSNLSNSSKGALPVPGKAQSFQEPAVHAANAPGGRWAEGGEEAEAEAVPSLRFLTRHRRTEHPRHAPRLFSTPKARPLKLRARCCLDVVMQDCVVWHSCKYDGRANFGNQPARRQCWGLH